MITALGKKVFKLCSSLLYAFGFFWTVLRELFRLRGRNRVGIQVVVMQVLFTGVNALFIITLISTAVGTVIITQGLQLFVVGQKGLLYTILITIITRELGPILTAFIVMARSGVAIATELSSMVITHEVEAYISVGINPVSYLVVPRFIGVVLSMVALNMYFTLSGLAASFLVVQFVHPIPGAEYFANLLNQLSLLDVAASIIKSLVFGAVIALVSSYHGFKTRNSTTEIPVIVIRAVGQGFAMLIVADFIITMVYML